MIIIDDTYLELPRYRRGMKNKKTFVQNNKEYILKAIHDCNFEAMREISNFYYKTSGIYARLCRYMAYLYRYDWLVTPYINENTENAKVDEKVLQNFYQVLLYLDNFEVKRFFGEVALKVIRNGCY